MKAVIKFSAPPYRYELEVEIEKKESCSPHRTIDFDEIHEYEELSICGASWRGRREESAGQMVDEFRALCANTKTTPLATVNDTVWLNELCNIWERWHLNGMKSGSRAQIEAVDRIDWGTGRYDYTEAACTLTAQGLNPVTIPDGKDCAGKREYGYGRAWLVEPLPDDVKARVIELVTNLGGVWE